MHGAAAGWLLVAAALFGAEPKESYPYRVALPGYRYSFPRDHFEHPEFRTEWWYFTGNVRAPAGNQFGFELVFFRQAQRRGPSGNPSAWRVDDLYLAHLALTDVSAGRFWYRTRLNRAGPGIAGASFARQRIWNGNWQCRWEGERQRLEAYDGDFRLALDAAPVKPAVIHGRDGVSRKAGGRGKASHYVSFPRLAAKGEIGVGGRSFQVAGTAWMDHEWFSHQLESDQTGWDWFSVQFDDGRELMVYQLRHKDGTRDPYSAGTYVDEQGRPRHLTVGDFTLEPLETWTSEKTRARYPVKWRIRVPALGIDLECMAEVKAQELVAEDSATPSYWEGAVRYMGTARGVGYLEMTGYDKPVSLR